MATWLMKPSDFRAGSKSIYRNLGWGVPVIPAEIYAWSTQPFFSVMSEQIPNFPSWIFQHVNAIFFAASLYAGAALTLAFHTAICFAGHLIGVYERPPPYEFFLVRITATSMWLALAVSLLMVPVRANEGGGIGYIASMLQSSPVVFVAAFFVAGQSWQRNSRRGKVGLLEMYESKSLVRLFRSIELGSMLFILAGFVYLNRILIK